jgi:hypothetical protein
MPRFLCGALAVVCLSAIGCDSGPAMHTVKGKVIIKGSNQPLAGGTIMFQSVARPELQASGAIEEDGSFELFSNQGQAGMPEGEHRILIRPPELETGQRKLIHDKYRSYDTSGLTRTITAGENSFTIELDPPSAR